MPQELCPTCSGLGCGTCFGSGKVEVSEPFVVTTYEEPREIKMWRLRCTNCDDVFYHEGSGDLPSTLTCPSCNVSGPVHLQGTCDEFVPETRVKTPCRTCGTLWWQKEGEISTCDACEAKAGKTLHLQRAAQSFAAQRKLTPEQRQQIIDEVLNGTQTYSPLKLDAVERDIGPLGKPVEMAFTGNPQAPIRLNYEQYMTIRSRACAILRDDQLRAVLGSDCRSELFGIPVEVVH